MKKKILYIAALVICLSLVTGGTLAYYTGSDTARNVITTGAVDVTVVNQQRVGDELVPYPEQPISIMPGRTVSKIVSVHNEEQPAWVRLCYTVTVYDASGNVLEVTPEELADVVIIQPNGEGWTFRDGWWYCNAALETGETSEIFCENVKFSAEKMGNKFQKCSIVIDITAQGVQKANNGTSALDAMGWPET